MINQQLSLVIPRVFPNWVDEAKIIKIFREQQIGIISKVRIVRMPSGTGPSGTGPSGTGPSGTGPSGTGPSGTGPSGTGPSGTDQKHSIYKAYLYFGVWFENIISKNFQKRIYGKDKQARVVYDDPWYWTVFENTERLKLSKNDKRLMRLSAEMYKNTLFVQTQQEEIARELAQQKHQLVQQKHQLAQQKHELAQQKHELAQQNISIQILQDFCIQHGLEIPFWSANHPPSAEVSSLETLSAKTAVNCAEFVLQDSCEADSCEMDYELGEKFNYDFIPVNSYEEDWVTENPYTNNTPEQSRLCSYLDRDLPMYM